MKRLLAVIAVMICAEAAVCAQTMKPVILVQAKSGSGPGEYAFDINSLPRGFAVDDQERIYILDDYTNDRVQYYDSSGTYLGAIPLPPVAPPTAAERARNPSLPEQLTNAHEMRFIDGVLYALQRRCVNGLVDKACSVGHLLKKVGGGFVDADGDKNVRHILGKFSPRYGKSLEERLRDKLAQVHVKPEDAAKVFPLGDGCGVSRNCLMWDIFVDKSNNRWVLSSEGVRVFSSSGSLLYEASPEDAYIFSDRGNLYSIAYYDGEDGKHQAGVRLTKYSLQGQ